MLDWNYHPDTKVAVAMVNALNKHPDLTALAAKVFVVVYSEAGESRTVAQMAKRLGVTRQGVSKALRLLLAEGLVGFEKERIRTTSLIQYLQV